MCQEDRALCGARGKISGKISADEAEHSLFSAQLSHPEERILPEQQ
jgi:hypothetical protein